MEGPHKPILANICPGSCPQTWPRSATTIRSSLLWEIRFFSLAFVCSVGFRVTMLVSGLTYSAQLLPAASHLPRPALWPGTGSPKLPLVWPGGRTHRRWKGRAGGRAVGAHSSPHSQYKSAQAVFKLWLCNPDFFSLFTFQAGWFAFGVQKCGPWYICALSSSSPWRTLTFFHLEEESSWLVAWETKCTALYYLNVKRSWMFFCKRPIYTTLNSPGSQFYRLGSSLSLESSIENENNGFHLYKFPAVPLTKFQMNPSAGFNRSDPQGHRDIAPDHWQLCPSLCWACSSHGLSLMVSSVIPSKGAEAQK